MVQGRLCDGGSPHHSCNFMDPVIFSYKRGDHGGCALIDNLFLNFIVIAALFCNLGQMGDADYLVFFRHFFEFYSYLV